MKSKEITFCYDQKCRGCGKITTFTTYSPKKDDATGEHEFRKIFIEMVKEIQLEYCSKCKMTTVQEIIGYFKRRKFDA